MLVNNKNKFILLTACFLAVFILSGCSNYSEDDYYYNLEEDSTYKPPEFNGYACTDDCSGHKAGYNWAEENGISDPNDCGGNSNSFIEGCESYAEEQQYIYDDYGEYDY